MSDCKEARMKLTKLYPKVCMLTGVNYRLTYHHTKKKREHGGRETVENGSLLNERIHCGFLHSVIERKCPFCFEETNRLLSSYKMAFDMGDTEYLMWYNDNVFPVFKDILQTQLEGKQRRRRRQ